MGIKNIRILYGNTALTFVYVENYKHGEGPKFQYYTWHL